MGLSDTTQIIQQITTSVAITLGGGWALFKAIHGRNFARHISTDVEVELVSLGNKANQREVAALKVGVCLSNRGAVQLPLVKDDDLPLSSVQIYGVTEYSFFPGMNVDWGEPVLRTPLFSSHDWLEPDSVAREELLLPIQQKPGEEDRIAYRVHVRIVYLRRKKFRRVNHWDHSVMLTV